MTQRALRWCGYTSRPSCGWIERDGIGVAFRRTPTGLDASGREGAFFVHALIWKAGQFPAVLLAGLWNADVWVLEPPNHPPDALPPVQTVAALGLKAPEPIGEQEVLRALAAHLENVAAGRRSAVALEPDVALAYAAVIADVLPARFGLPAFSTFEEPPHELEYDIVASTEQHRHFAPIAPAAAPGPVWIAAATLLLAERGGDDSAMQVVAALAERAGDLAAFATGVGRWMALETSPNHEHRSGGQGVALAASDPRLLARSFDRFGLQDIARGVASGHSIEQVFRSAAALGEVPRVVAALVAELGTRAAGEAVAALARVHAALGEATVIARLAADLGEELLRAGTLVELDATQTHVLLSLQTRQPRMSVVDTLLDSAVATALVVDDASLPSAWRGHAAGSNPELASETVLTSLLGASVQAAREFSARVSDAGLDVLGGALLEAPTELGLKVVELVGQGLSERGRAELALPVVQRLRPPEQLPATIRFAPPAEISDARWGHAILDAQTAAVLDARHSQRDLPRLVNAPLPYDQAPRFLWWRDILARLDAAPRSSMRNTEFAWASRCAASLPDVTDRDAAFELIVDRSADAFIGDGEDWMTAMTLVAHEAGDHASAFSDRLARTALRGGRRTRREIAYWTILWIAGQLDAGRLSSKQLRDSPASDVWRRLHAIDVDVLVADGKARGRSGAAQRWLRYNRDTLAQHFSLY